MSDNKCIMSRSKYSFVNFINGIISRLYENGQYKSWQHYRSARNSFMRFRKNKDLSLRKLTAEVVESYEAYLRQKNVCRNTSSFYMRILRAAYNRAAEQGLIGQQYPFRHVYTGIDKTRKRAISFDAIRRIRRLRLQHASFCDMAKDVFLMSFYLRGISFVDLAHLKKSDIQNGCLRYNRSKTRQQITVRWELQMQELVDKYKNLTSKSPYLFPFIPDNGHDSATKYRFYHNAESRIAYHLKKIRRLAGIHENLTLYVARHSWATAARSLHRPISVISEALGHDSEVTTQIYLRSINTSEVDSLNAEILSALSEK